MSPDMGTAGHWLSVSRCRAGLAINAYGVVPAGAPWRSVPGGGRCPVAVVVTHPGIQTRVPLVSTGSVCRQHSVRLQSCSSLTHPVTLLFPAPFFQDCMSENTLDELNIEVLRNKLYKVTAVSVAQSCPGSVRRNALPCHGGPGRCGAHVSASRQEAAEGGQPSLCPQAWPEHKVAKGRRPRDKQHLQAPLSAELALSSVLCESQCLLPVHTIVLSWLWAAYRDDR